MTDKPNLEMQTVDLEAIRTSGTNPRKHFDAAAMAELIESVKTHGVLQPVLLRRRAVGPGYELVAGERRFRAARAAGLQEIPALVRDLSDEEVLEIQVVENLQRKDLHPLEEADGYQQLRRAKYDVARIAERVGRSVAYVYDRLRLANLTPTVRELFATDEITAGHAVLLARLTAEQQQVAVDAPEALFTAEHLLWDPEQPAKNPRKPRSVRELAAWIDGHCKLDVEQADLEQLFPEVASALNPPDDQPHGPEPTKVVQITRDHYVQPTARDGSRIVGPRSWKTATKACAFVATGVIVVGPGRGKAFPVCVEKKKCKTHWGAEIRAAAKAAEEREAAAPTKGAKPKADPRESKWQAEDRKRAERRAQWERAAPEVLRSVAAHLFVEVNPHTGLVAGFLRETIEEVVGWQGPLGKALQAQLSGWPARTPEQFLHRLAFAVLCDRALDFDAAEEFPKLAKKLFDMDVMPIVKAAAKAEPAPEPKPAKKAKGKAA